MQLTRLASRGGRIRTSTRFRFLGGQLKKGGLHQPPFSFFWGALLAVGRCGRFASRECVIEVVQFGGPDCSGPLFLSRRRARHLSRRRCSAGSAKDAQSAKRPHPTLSIQLFHFELFNAVFPASTRNPAKTLRQKNERPVGGPAARAWGMEGLAT